MSPLDKIRHIVVLMLENRSFDNILGKLYPKSSEFDGLSGNETNPDDQGRPINVWNQRTGSTASIMGIPDLDPGELYTNMNHQLFGSTNVPSSTSKPMMQGFVADYVVNSRASGKTFDPRAVMHYYLPEQVPVISRLARQFAVSDRWFASAPCQTWPNRFFVHTGTADGYENNSPVHFPYRMPTIFNRITQAGTPGGWKIYFHDMPQSLTLSELWSDIDHFRFFDEFKADAKAGTLPAYAFIEPRYYPDVALPNDAHPPHIVTLADQLIADVYNCIRGGPGWPETLLIITFDEHGGSYDHVPPPAAVPPSLTPTKPFNFDRYGVRVPAVIISPYIRQGTVLRADSGYPFDHTSIIATLRQCFNLGPPLTARDAVAPTLAGALTLLKPDNVGPESIDYEAYVPSPGELFSAQNEKPNGMQQSLLELSEYLPAARVTGGFNTFVSSYLDLLELGLRGTHASQAQTANEAVQVIKARLNNLF